MSVMLIIFAAMPAMSLVKDMHKGAEQENKIRQILKEMGSVLVPQKQSSSNNYDKKCKILEIPGTFIFLCHDTPPCNLCSFE